LCYNAGIYGEDMDLETPLSLQKEHEDLHSQMAEVRKLGGKTSQALERLVETMHHHFVYEEERAMPVLALIKELALKPHPPVIDQNLAKKAIKLADDWADKYNDMVKAHEKICKAAEELAEVALEENQTAAVEFSDMLINHAHVEEDVIYPAVILVGKYLKGHS